MDDLTSDDGSAELLRRCIEGEEAGWNRFVERFAPFLRRTVRETLRIKVPHLARLSTIDDLLQDLFAHFLANDRRVLREYDGRASLQTYLRVTAVSRVLTVLRLQRRFQRSLREPPPGFQERETLDPQETLLRKESAEELEKALERLSPKERLAWLWIRRDGLDYRRTARLLRLSINSIGPLVHQAQEKLRRFLKKVSE